MNHADRSGWKATLIGGPYDCAKPRLMMSTEPLDNPPPKVNVYQCSCCEETVVVAPGLHPREDELGSATVYLQSVLANPGPRAVPRHVRPRGPRRSAQPL